MELETTEKPHKLCHCVMEVQQDLQNQNIKLNDPTYLRRHQVIELSDSDKSSETEPESNARGLNAEGIADVFKPGSYVNKYKIIRKIGKGTFGEVFQLEYGFKRFALKVIKKTDKNASYIDIQSKIARFLNQCDPAQEQPIVRLLESFNYQGYFCMRYKLHGHSLYRLLYSNGFKPQPRKIVKAIMKQILKGIAFIHQNKVIHTDLKPQNIILENTRLLKMESYNGHPNFIMPTSEQIRIIDFGSAIKYTNARMVKITTLNYRAPQAALQCCVFGYQSDVWSIGCIFYQLLTGKCYFPCMTQLGYLCMLIRHSKDVGLPKWMLTDAQSPDFKQYNIYDLAMGGESWRELSDNELQQLKKFRTYRQTFTAEEDYQLRDVLGKLLEINPRKRITCEQALLHPYFTSERY